MKNCVVGRRCRDPRFLVSINLGSFRIFFFYHNVLGAVWGFLSNYVRYRHNKKAKFLLDKYKGE